MLFSGPSGDRSMGIILVRAGSLDEAKQVLDTEPFQALGLRTYEIIEWDVHQGSRPRRASQVKASRLLAKEKEASA